MFISGSRNTSDKSLLNFICILVFFYLIKQWKYWRLAMINRKQRLLWWIMGERATLKMNLKFNIIIFKSWVLTLLVPFQLSFFPKIIFLQVSLLVQGSCLKHQAETKKSFTFILGLSHAILSLQCICEQINSWEQRIPRIRFKKFSKLYTLRRHCSCHSSEAVELYHNWYNYIIPHLTEMYNCFQIFVPVEKRVFNWLYKDATFTVYFLQC